MRNIKPTVMAYYFPNWHVDPRNEQWHGPGWTEWEVLKYSRPRFEGHKQPKKPLWGYLAESDPEVMAKKIDTAVDHGVDGFIFDWYWFADGGYRLNCIDKGFLGAKNCEKAKFAVMWCNHDPIYVHPAGKTTGNMKLLDGDLTVQSFYEGTEHCIKNYFCRPNYLRNSKGQLYFCIHLPERLMNNFGGPDGMRLVLKDFRRRVKEAGLGELDINAMAEFSEGFYKDPKACMEKMKYMGFDSFSSHGLPPGIVDDLPFPHRRYSECMRCNIGQFENFTNRCEGFPYNILLYKGYDLSPRSIPSEVYGQYGGFFDRIISDNTPEKFEEVCRAGKKFFEEKGTGEYILIYAWNEWTEGGYLEPDTDDGYGYLEAIKRTFKEN